MTQEPFRPEGMRTDDVRDADGRPVGRLVATRYDEDGQEVAALVLELAEDVRRDRLVHEARIQVAARIVRLENGAPVLTLTLEEVLADQQVPHARPDHRKGVPDRPPHMGAPADPTRAAGTERSVR